MLQCCFRKLSSPGLTTNILIEKDNRTDLKCSFAIIKLELVNGMLMEGLKEKKEKRERKEITWAEKDQEGWPAGRWHALGSCYCES